VSNTLVVRFRGSGVAGCGLLVTGYWLRVASCALRGRVGRSEGGKVRSLEDGVAGF
jgi:hypothetical protein